MIVAAEKSIPPVPASFRSTSPSCQSGPTGQQFSQPGSSALDTGVRNGDRPDGPTVRLNWVMKGTAGPVGLNHWLRSDSRPWWAGLDEGLALWAFGDT
jgi:hypothetical protein